MLSFATGTLNSRKLNRDWEVGHLQIRAELGPLMYYNMGFYQMGNGKKVEGGDPKVKMSSSSSRFY